MEGDKTWDFLTPGIPDDNFWRGDIPITKEEYRTLALSRLRLKRDHRLLDVGAGTGTISVEAGVLLKNGMVYAVEKEERAVELIRKNVQSFNLNNVEIIYGSAPGALAGLNEVDRVFVGGSGGERDGIIKRCYQLLCREGIIVLNCILLESVSAYLELLKEVGFVDIELISAGVARGKTLGTQTMLEPLNPVFIISGRKGE